jgi:putative transposase
MPRLARLDAPGLLQHVMARGIEGREIFKDDQDRKLFLGRLAIVLDESQTQCYAWSLLPNHFHLLLRTSQTPLSKVMRRLMTGYAVTFNRRYKRSGHLFQNRYRSIVCEEDPYLLELIRYIHLNPLRAGLVKNLKELDKYPWSGHAAILGHSKNPLIPDQGDKHKRASKPDKTLAERTVEDVLGHFGDTIKDARRRYRQFVKQGADQGTRPEFQGGGLVRSAGGDKRGLLGRKKEERELGDERILGSGDFVNQILQEAGERWEKGKRRKIKLPQLINKVSSCLDLNPEAVLSTSRRRKVSEARSLISYLAINDMPAPCSAACS